MEYESQRDEWNTQTRRLISDYAELRALRHVLQRRSRLNLQGDSGFNFDDGDEPLHV